MSNIVMNTTEKTVSASAFLPGQAYKSALALASAYEGEIGKTEDGFFKATFNTAETAEQFKLDWETGYNANRKPAPASKPATAQKGKKADTKKSKPSSTKKGKGDIKVSKAVKEALAPYAGKGKSVNHEVADVLRGMGIVPNGTEWDYWTTIR